MAFDNFGGVNIEAHESATGQTNWAVVLRVVGPDDGKKETAHLKASAALNGLLSWNTLGGNGSDVASASVAAFFLVNGDPIVNHPLDPFSAGIAPSKDEKPINDSGSKDLGMVEEGDTVTLSGLLVASAHAHRAADEPGTFASTATSKFDNSLGFGVALVPIPEPQTYVLMLAGLTVIVVVARRRSR
jgi:hypothetical protein